MIAAIFRRILHLVEETKVVATENKRDLEQIKQMMMPQSVDYSDTLKCLSRPAETVEEFEDFCVKLDDRPFRKNVVCILSECYFAFA